MLSQERILHGVHLLTQPAAALIATDSGEHQEEPLVRRDTKAPDGNGERDQLSHLLATNLKVEVRTVSGEQPVQGGDCHD